MAKTVRKAKKSVVKKPARKRAAPARRAKAPRRPSRGWTAKVARSVPLRWILGMAGGLAVVAAGVLVASRVATSPRTEPPSAPPPAETAKTEQSAPARATWGALMSAFARADALGVADRITFWSELLYKSKAAQDKLRDLGPAPQIADNAPLIPAAFDCTTFVETVATLARSASPSDFYRNLLAMRYLDSRATYTYRNHFPEADWIPNNLKAGILSDITSEVAGASGMAPKEVTKEIRRGEWLAQQIREGKITRELASTQEHPEWERPVRASVNYLPIEKMEQFIPHIPNGTVMNIVHMDDATKPVLITHQGFVIVKDGERYFRHANPPGVIRTQKLSDYLKAMAKKGPASFRVVGVNLNQINS